MHDLVIRGGTIVDGTGAPRYVADIAVDGGNGLAVVEEGSARYWWVSASRLIRS